MAGPLALTNDFAELQAGPLSKADEDGLFEGLASPLGSFAPRARESHALGLICDNERIALVTINKMRIPSAHRADRHSFDIERLASIIAELDDVLQGILSSAIDRYLETMTHEMSLRISDERRKFIAASVMLLAILNIRVKVLQDEINSTDQPSREAPSTRL